MARIRTGDVKVVGLSDLNRRLKELGPAAQKELRETNKSVAEFVADDARAAALTIGGVAAKVAPSIKAKGTNLGGGVSIGGAAYPFAGGAEFGAIKYKQFHPWRGNKETAGYFVYPSIRRDADRITTEYSKALDRLIERHDLD